MAPGVRGEGQGTSEVRGEQNPCGHGSTRPGRRAGTSEVKGKQDPSGHGPACPGRRAWLPLCFPSSLSIVSSWSPILLPL